MKRLSIVLLLLAISLSANIGFTFECNKAEILRQAKPFYDFWKDKPINDEAIFGLMIFSEQLVACNEHISKILPDGMYPSFRSLIVRVIKYCKENQGMEEAIQEALRLKLLL